MGAILPTPTPVAKLHYNASRSLLHGAVRSHISAPSFGPIGKPTTNKPTTNKNDQG